MTKKEAKSQCSTQERDELERNIREQIEEILKGDRGERSTDEDGVVTVILKAKTNLNGSQTQLKIEDYPEESGNFTFVSKLQEGEPDGYIIHNKENDVIAGREEPLGISVLSEFCGLLSASNNHPAPQPPPPQA